MNANRSRRYRPSRSEYGPSETAVFSALSSPVRRDILELLSRRELSAGELVSEIRLSKATVSDHMAKLRFAGLVSERWVGKKVFYRFCEDRLDQIFDGFRQHLTYPCLD